MKADLDSNEIQRVVKALELYDANLVATQRSDSSVKTLTEKFKKVKR